MSVPRSRISWTDYSGGDSGFCLGCTPVSAGCAHCYAKSIYDHYGRDFSDVRTYPDKLRRLAQTRFEPGDTPFRRGPGSRPMVFVVDMGDLFHERVSTGFIHEALHVLCDRADVDWQILTKRADRMWAILADAKLSPNLWLGVSAESQAMADQRIPLLLQVPAAVRFVSVEPMLGPVDLTRLTLVKPEPPNGPGVWLNALTGYVAGPDDITDMKLSWVIAGGESSPKRRPFDPAWARSLKDQCQAAGVAFFGKQASGLRPGEPLLIDGQECKEWPR